MRSEDGTVVTVIACEDELPVFANFSGGGPPAHGHKFDVAARQGLTIDQYDA
ncbi:MAG: hypothetical protein WD738_24645 [Pirellulales bacterium]